MVVPIAGLPEGVLGFRLSGKLGRDEYHDALTQPIHDEPRVFESGERQQATAWLAG